MEDDDKLTTPLLEDEDDPAAAVNTPGCGLTVDTSTISEGLHGNPAASPASPSYYDASSYWPTNLTNKRRRASYMDDLILQRQQAMKSLLSELDLAVEEEEGNAQSPTTARKRAQENDSEFVIKLQHFLANMPSSERAAFRQYVPSMEIRLVDLSYRVPTSNEEWGKNKIRTLYNTSPLYAMKKLYQNITTRGRVSVGGSAPTITTNVLTNVNLVLKPSKMYLVLGPPLSGKTSLLKAIAGLLPQDNFPHESYSFHGSSDSPEKYITGQILYNNLVCGGTDVDEAQRTLFKNLVAFVRQSDDHAPRLTVAETLLFSGMCKDVRIRKNDKGVRDDGKVGLALAGLGLSRVKDTFVGNEQIRGVSGGQRRRVTLGEMIVYDTPLLCGDEISTGLDTASTVDILRILSYLSRLMDRITVVSLLQPSPEAVSLFDEVILLGDDGGHIIYEGPTENAHQHFLKLGYVQPDGMDDADFLLAVASADRKHLYRPKVVEADDTVTDGKVHTSEQLGELFKMSKEHDTIMKNQLEVWEHDWKQALQEEDGRDYGGDNSDAVIPTHFRKKYQNSLYVSTWLNFRRGIILWTRDYANIIAKLIQCFNVGLSTGFLFHNDPVDSSFFGAIYQVTVTIMSTSSTTIFQQWDDRAIFHKHYESNFYSALSFVLGKTLAMVPQMFVDTIVLGTLVYWIVGFVARAENFIIFLCLFFVFTLMMMTLFGFLASFAPNKSVYLAAATVTIFANTVFSGYIVSPTVFPHYWYWLYWFIPSSWFYRAMVINQFVSPDYPGDTGDAAMISKGFHRRDNTAFSRAWIGYSFLFFAVALTLSTLASAFCLHYFKMEPKQVGKSETLESSAETEPEKEVQDSEEESKFIPVDLVFSNLSYEVKASTGSKKLRLLNDITGMFKSGRMCALMGESGAGKTTLLDVIALRKNEVISLGSGRASKGVSGNVLLNGFAQEETSFRRCSGYVEQFDVQSPELTVRETIKFSAQLRLEKTSPVYSTPGGLDRHVEHIIDTLELTNEADYLVGSKEAGGLSIEQTKRLSIAVELAASPSIIFLDEPTSGLDARAALLVMNALRKMAKQGRTIVATIHQPSSAIFDMFDDLLLLKKGGEVVFHGELGVCSSNLVSYFEDQGATTMSKGENPASWMLNVLGESIMIKGEDDEEKSLDFALAWKQSSNCEAMALQAAQASKLPDEAKQITYSGKYAVKWYRRDLLMSKRLVLIYWRSPMYNLSRMLLASVIALFLGSIFIPQRSYSIFSEPNMNSLLSTIYINALTMGQLSITSILPIMGNVRDMYYRHKASGMLGSRSMGIALEMAEWRFIVLTGTLGTLFFISLIGMDPSFPTYAKFGKGCIVWGFFTINAAIYSYAGQLFVCLVPGPGVAMTLANIFIGMNNTFAGLIARPNQIEGNFILFELQYWLVPAHYVFESITTVWFGADSRLVEVRSGSQYYDPLNCEDSLTDGVCLVTVEDYVNAFFGGKWHFDNTVRNIIILGVGWLLIVRLLTFAALQVFTFSGK